MRLICFILLCSISIRCFGQTQQQATVDSELDVGLPQQMLLDVREPELSRFKRQALQSVSVSSGWLGELSAGGVNNAFLDTSIGTGIPLGSFDNILAVAPRFRVDWIDSPDAIDIPSSLYLVESQLFYRRPLNSRLNAMGIFSPSLRSDFTTSENAFRVFALGLLNWEAIQDELTLSAGAVYLGRADLPVLPAVGLSWTPSRRVKLDLRFPESQFAYRLRKNGALSETWTSIALGIGGNTWAVSRNSGLSDELSLRDIRLTSKLEHIIDGGGGWFIESGYAFARRIEYEQSNSEIQLGDAVILQAGWRY